jgi:hypothetical protein
MLASGVLDIVLASIIIFGLPGTSAWTMGLLIGINMIVGGASLLAMGGMPARKTLPRWQHCRERSGDVYNIKVRKSQL